MTPPARPPHPGEVLKRLMQQHGLAVDDITRHGLPADWVQALLHRYEELAPRSGQRRIALLARATRTAPDYWVQVQQAWGTYCRQRSREAGRARLAAKGRQEDHRPDARWFGRLG